MAGAAASRARLAESYIQVVPVIGAIGAQISAQINAGISSPQVQQATQHAGQQIGNDIGDSAGSAAGEGIKSQIIGALGGAAIGGMLVSQVNEALGRMNTTAKVSAQLDLSPEDAKKIQDATKQVFNGGYGESYDEVATTMKQIVGTITDARKMSADELAQMGKDFSNVTSTFEIDGEVAAQAINSMVGSGMAKDAKEALSTIAQGMGTLGASGATWADSLTEFAGDYASLGLNGAESIALVNSAIKAGIKDTDVFSDSLNEIQIKVADGSAAESLTALGFDAEQVKKDFAAGGDVAQKAFTDVLQKLQKTNDRSLWAGVFGTQAEDYFSAFQKMDVGAIAGKEVDTKNLDKLDKSLTNINSIVLSIGRTIQQVVLDKIQPFIDWAGPKVEEFAKYINENKDAADALGFVIGTGLVVAVAALTAGLWLMVAPVLANPLFWIIGGTIVAVAALVGAIWWLSANWEDVTANISQLWGGMVNWLGEIWGGFANWWSEMWGGFFNWIGDGFNTITKWATDMGKGIANFFIGIANNVIGLINMMIDAINGIKFKAPDWAGGMEFAGFGIPKVSTITPMKNGGTIGATPGGTLALLAEAGRAESVTDAITLNKNLEAQTALMNSLSGSGATVINVYQQPGESTEELARRLQQYNEFNGNR